eukprot:2481101-Pleurochrysis_carterae.AAC.1
MRPLACVHLRSSARTAVRDCSPRLNVRVGESSERARARRRTLATTRAVGAGGGRSSSAARQSRPPSLCSAWSRPTPCAMRNRKSSSSATACGARSHASQEAKEGESVSE